MNTENPFRLFLLFVFLYFASALSAQEGKFGTHFRHIVSVQNTEGVDTYLDHPELNNHPNAIIIVSPNLMPNQIAAANNFNLFYNTTTGRWAIRNINSTNSFPMGCAFTILIPSASQTAFQVVSPGGGSTFAINHPATNGNPNKLLFITPVYPGYIAGNGNRQFVAMYAPSPFNSWGVATLNSTIEQGDVFNVLVLNQSDYAFVHRVTESNSTTTEIDHPFFNSRPEVNFLFQRQFNFNNGGSTTWNTRKKSTAYINGKWHIRIDDGSNTFFQNEDYNIALLNFSEGLYCSHPEIISCGYNTLNNTLSTVNDNALADPLECDDVNEPVGSGGQRWYKFTAPADYNVILTTCGNSDFNPTIHVYTGACGDFTCVASMSNECANPTGTALSFQVEEGTEYFIRVGGDASAQEVFSLEMACEVLTATRHLLNTDTEIMLYPNPAHSSMRIRNNSPTGGWVAYEIFDLSGKVLSKGVHDGIDNFELNINHLNNGSYLLKLASANFVATRKFVVLR